MRRITILKSNDVAKYIAEAFHVPVEKVHIRRYLERKGYGYGEHDEPEFHIEIENDSDE